ncbi:MAG: hypothetical protein F6J93_23920 [Oscillatoria sp. SIO1A7]|nr:hypothetical protein [Oscillatoria sp. SIO1A7]
MSKTHEGSDTAYCLWAVGCRVMGGLQGKAKARSHFFSWAGLTQNIHIWLFVGAIPPRLPRSLFVVA